MFLKKKRNNLKERRTALCTLRTCLFLSSIILVWGSTYPTHLRRLVSLQNRIVRVIRKKGFDAHTEPLFKNFMIFKLEDIFFASRKFMFSFKNTSIPSSFSGSILRTNQVHGYNTHSLNRFYILFCRNNMRKCSVFY